MAMTTTLDQFCLLRSELGWHVHPKRYRIKTEPQQRTLKMTSLDTDRQETLATTLVTKTDTTPNRSSSSESYLGPLNANMQKVFGATELQIGNLKTGEKISVKLLSARVAKFLNMPQSQVAPFISMFIKSYDKCTMVRGRHGGVYRGSVPRKADTEHRCSACGQKLRKKKEDHSDNAVEAVEAA